MKIIFMGTPDFTIPILDALIQTGHEIVLVVTQPDKCLVDLTDMGRKGFLLRSCHKLSFL